MPPRLRLQWQRGSGFEIHSTRSTRIKIGTRRWPGVECLNGGTADAQLARRLMAGDEGALGEVYDRYGGLAFSLALTMVGTPEAAEDVVQEAFYRLWRQAPTYDPARSRLSTWLLNITRNLCIDELRRRAARPHSATAPEVAQHRATAPDPAAADPAEQAWLGQRRSTVLAALASLPSAQRQALELAYFGGLSQSEIADRLGDPLGTIKTRMRLGMQKLRESLESEWWSEGTS
jgi:RNA polymerase sigma-70 factor (ECF subfamily)